MSDPTTLDGSFVSLLWQKNETLTAEAIAGPVVRPGTALGPIALGEPAAAVLDRLNPKRLLRSPDGGGLQLEPEHRSQPGFATGTVAHHLTAYNLASDWLPCARQCWLEWASDEESRTIVQVRFCVRLMLGSDNDNGEIVSKLRAAFDAAHGAGQERKKKHRKSRVRPVDWRPGDGLLTLGDYDKWGWRYVVAELTAARCIDWGYMRLEAFQ